MKKLLAVIMALVMMFTLTSAFAETTQTGSNEVELELNLTGTLSETATDEIRINWISTDGAFSAEVEASRTWNTTTLSWNEPSAKFKSDPTLTKPVFSVSVVNYSSPGHDYQGSLSFGTNDFDAQILPDGTLASQVASGAFGTSPEIIPSTLGTTLAQRTKTQALDFSSLTVDSIIADQGGDALGMLKSIGSNGDAYLYDHDDDTFISTGTSILETNYLLTGTMIITAYTGN